MAEYGTKEWWDEHRAGKYGGYKGGYSSADDPYLGMSQADIDREQFRVNMDKERVRDEQRMKKAIEDEREMLRNMSLEDRNKFLSDRDERRRREEYYRGMDSEKRAQAYDYENTMRRFDEQMERERLERESKRKAFNDAKSRYKRLSMFSKLKHSLSGTSPNRLFVNRMGIDEINDLYRGKRR